MHDLKYLELQKLSVAEPVEEMVQSLKSACLADVARVFQRNIGRVENLAAAPATLVSMVKFMQGLMDIFAFSSARSSVEETVTQMQMDLMALQEQAKVLSNEEMENMLVTKAEELRRPLPSIDEEKEVAWKVVHAFVEQGSDIRTAFETIQFSVLTGTWTAFESMAGDLWEATLNAHPKGLSELKGRTARKKAAKSGKGAESLQAPTGPAEGTKIDVAYLAKYRYDLSGRMGTILKNRFKSRLLREIRDAYASAFHVDYKKIDASLNSRDLDALEAMRNVLVHRAGLVDDMFVRRVENIPHLSGFKEGDPLLVDGALVASTVNSVVSSCIDLIKAVDEWLVNHAEPAPRPLYEPS